MPTTSHHRGPHPDDARLFGPGALPTLRRAAAEIAWLLERGYPMRTAVSVVGGHHQLESRQRLALQRATAAASRVADRRARALAPADVRGQTLAIDGFNLIITLEVGLSGGLLLEGADGALRDLAGLRGSYTTVDETAPALDRIGEALRALGVGAAHVFLDAPVSNSGRLRARILERLAGVGVPLDVELVPSADARLARLPFVVSADAAVLDRCSSWCNLAAWILRDQVPNAWKLRLDVPEAPSAADRA